MNNIVYIVYSHATHHIYDIYSEEEKAIKRKEIEEKDLAMGGYYNNRVEVIKKVVL